MMKFDFLILFSALLLIEVAGFNSSHSKILEGNDADLEAFSYVVQLVNSQGAYFCAGVLVKQDVVLTAAHCLFHKSSGFPRAEKQINVVAGNAERSKSLDGTVYRKVKNIIVHPDYNWETTDNDLAILKLEKPFDSSNPFISTIQISSQISDKPRCVISGWGKNETHDGTDFLKYANVNLISRSDCQSYYMTDIISEAMICANWKDGAACQGDSGGPLTCNGELNGLVSTGADCKERDAPGIYTNIPKFGPWIRKYINS